MNPTNILYKNNIPWNVVLELTNACQFDCIHCFQKYYKSKFHYEISYDRAICIINDLKKLGTMKITLSGGEPTINTNFVEILNYLIDNGFSVEVLSNGIINEKFLYKIRNNGLLSFDISLHGLNNVHDNIVCFDGAFQRISNTLKILKTLSIKFSISSVVIKQNLKNILEFSNWIIKNNYKWKHTPVIWGKNISNIRLSNSELLEYYSIFPEELKLMENNSNLTVVNKKFDKRCNAGYTTLTIAADEEVFPCTWLRYSIGNIRETNICNLWNSGKQINKFRNSNLFGYDNCNLCHYSIICKRCPAYSDSYNSIPNEWCRIMDMQKQAIKIKKVSKI